jgi:CHASE2 domain-containing sensor protein
MADPAPTHSRRKRQPRAGRVDNPRSQVVLKKKFASWLLVLPLLVFALFWVGALGVLGVENLAERYYLRLVSPYSAKPFDSRHIKVLYIEGAEFKDSAQRQKWRSRHVDLLKKLDAAGAKVVAFDFAFAGMDKDSEAATRAFVGAIRAVEAKGKTRVVIGLDPPNSLDLISQAVPPEQQGLVWAGGSVMEPDTKTHLRRVLLAESKPLPPEVQMKDEPACQPWAFPLAVYLTYINQAGQARVRPHIDVSGGRIVLYRGGMQIGEIATETEVSEQEHKACGEDSGKRRLASLPLLMAPADSVAGKTYQDFLREQDVSTLGQYKDAIVIVGARSTDDQPGQDVVELVPGTKPAEVYGHQVHASILSDLLTGRYPRRLGYAWQLCLLYVLALSAGVGRRFLPKSDVKLPIPFLGDRSVPIGLGIVFLLYVFFCIALYRQRLILLDVGYHLVILFAAYYLIGGALVPAGTGSGTQQQHRAATQPNE